MQRKGPRRLDLIQVLASCVAAKDRWRSNAETRRRHGRKETLFADLVGIGRSALMSGDSCDAGCWKLSSYSMVVGLGVD